MLKYAGAFVRYRETHENIDTRARDLISLLVTNVLTQVNSGQIYSFCVWFSRETVWYDCWIHIEGAADQKGTVMYNGDIHLKDQSFSELAALPALGYIIWYEWKLPGWGSCSVTWRVWGLWNNLIYRKISNIRRTLVGNNIVDHSDVVGASPVGAAPTTSSFST